MASPESLRKGIPLQKFQKENTPIVSNALSFVSVMGTRLKTSKDLEGSVIQNYEVKYTAIVESVNSEQVSHNILLMFSIISFFVFSSSFFVSFDCS